MNLLAIDPATKKLGAAYFHHGDLLCSTTIISIGRDRQGRQQEIITNLLAWIVKNVPETNDQVQVVCEEPMLRGKANNSMQRILGALEWAFVPTGMEYVAPKTVKKIMGSGNLDKLEVALAAGKRVKNKKAKNLVADMIEREAWDESDAVAIGLTWMDRRGA